MGTNANKLSAYTIASNCSDLDDIKNGMDELTQYFNDCSKVGKKPAQSTYVRFAKLFIKQTKLKNKK